MTYLLSFTPFFLPIPQVSTAGDSFAGAFSTIILTPDHNSQGETGISHLEKAHLDSVSFRSLFLFPGLHEL